MAIGIRDILGVRCPMGCGETLHLMQSGMIVCMSQDCPLPMAAQQILSEPETCDIVEFTPDGITILHPLRERLGSLFSCPVHEAALGLGDIPAAGPGRYRAWLGEFGLELERIAA